jgi:heat shock protein 4
VEVTGGSSRVPALIKILKEFFNKEPSRTLNAKEVISRGCALQCAMLSPIFRVREFEVKDVNPYPVDMMWDRNGEVSRNHIFESYSAIPTTKQITTAYRETALDITAEYAETAPLPEGFDRFIGKFTVGPPKPPAPTASSTKLKIKVQLNLHDVVDVVGAQQIDEEEYEEVVKKPAAAASAAKDVSMEGADEPSKPPPDATDDVTMADTPAEPSPPDQAEASDAQPMETDKEAAAAAGTDGNASAETEEVVKKRRQKKTDLPIQVQLPGWDQAQVKKMRGREEEMAWQDKKQRLTNEAKNALEAYIYDFRNKLSDQLADFVTDDHKGNLTVKLEQTEDWLYDEGEDQEREVYENKLEELRSQGIPIERRAIEHQTRPSAAQSLLGTARRLEQAAQSTDAKYSHISPEDKRKVVDECQKAVAWLQEKHKLQEGAKKSDDPMLLTADIRKKEDTLVRFAEPILNKPAPPPPKPEAKKDEKAQGDAMETDAAGADTAAAGPTAAEAAQAAANNASKDDATMEA